MACSLALILQDFLQTVMSLFTVCYTCLHGVDLVQLDSSEISSPHNYGSIYTYTTVESNLTSVTCLCRHDSVTLLI